MESKGVVLIEYILKMIEYVCLTNSLWCRRYMCDLIGYLYFMSISAVTMHLKDVQYFCLKLHKYIGLETSVMTLQSNLVKFKVLQNRGFISNYQ